jgi:hypothetical protein
MDMPTTETASSIQALVTSAGIILGGLWAFWRWSLSEYLRHRREIPSFEGDMTAGSVCMENGCVLVSVSCKWKNMSAVPLSVNTARTRVTVFDVPDSTQPGAVSPRLNNVVERHVRCPWEHWSDVVLEPHTCSELQAHFLVEEVGTYLLACRLEAVSKKNNPVQVWVRELIWRPDRSAKRLTLKQ